MTPDIAQKAEKAGADIIVATGMDEGGTLPGHNIGTFSIVPLIVDSVKDSVNFRIFHFRIFHFRIFHFCTEKLVIKMIIFSQKISAKVENSKVESAKVEYSKNENAKI